MYRRTVVLSKTKVDKLGDRLRRSAEPTDEDLALLQQFIAEHREAEQYVVDRLRSGVRPHRAAALANRFKSMCAEIVPLPGEDSSLDGVEETIDEVVSLLRSRGPDAPLLLRPASRVKTLDTTLEKLRRERTRLSTIQDIAGARVVVEGGRVDQDAVALGLREVFPDAEVKDRRTDPSSGYRAVHLIVPVARKRVEIQVRTKPQDLWAQVFEGLADRIGRQIRYGHLPDDPDSPMVLGSADATSRRELVSLLVRFSDQIAGLEESASVAETAEAMADVVEESLSGVASDSSEWSDLVELLQDLRADADRRRRRAEDTRRQWEAVLEVLVQSLSARPER